VIHYFSKRTLFWIVIINNDTNILQISPLSPPSFWPFSSRGPAAADRRTVRSCSNSSAGSSGARVPMRAGGSGGEGFCIPGMILHFWSSAFLYASINLLFVVRVQCFAGFVFGLYSSNSIPSHKKESEQVA
jgi:hypothetical protein